jgi:lipoprotein-anchoring transpeptidase ErfK/SrfK
MKAYFWLLGIALAAGGCVPSVLQSGLPDPKLTERDKLMMAKAEADEWRIPVIRNKVRYRTSEKPGTVVVDTGSRHLYYVMAHGEAIEYRIATGAEAYGWTGRATVGQMKEWPTWMPTASIMAQWPQFKVYLKHGPLQGQWDNPLGARALYLFQGNKDTLYRIHGTNEPNEIGQAVSSGCIRMRNLDAIDLYTRVHIGTPVVVI